MNDMTYEYKASHHGEYPVALVANVFTHIVHKEP